MFEDTGIFLLWLIATYCLVQIIFGINDGLKATTKELETELYKKINDMVHRVKSEKDNDVLYWFDQDNGEFLGQGANYAEMIDVLRERFPKHVFYFETEDQQYIIAESTEWKPIEVQIQAVTDS